MARSYGVLHKQDSTVLNMSQTEQIEPRLLKAKPAARYLSMSAWKLRNLVQTGEIACIMGDGTSPWLFDIDDLNAWIERRKQTL